MKVHQRKTIKEKPIPKNRLEKIRMRACTVVTRSSIGILRIQIIHQGR